MRRASKLFKGNLCALDKIFVIWESGVFPT